MFCVSFKASKKDFKINNDYLNAYIRIVELINNHIEVFFTPFFIFCLIFLGLYWIAYYIANHFNSAVFWEPYSYKNKNMLKNIWEIILRSTIFYKKLNAKGITYFVSMKYFFWYKKLWPVVKSSAFHTKD